MATVATTLKVIQVWNRAAPLTRDGVQHPVPCTLPGMLYEKVAHLVIARVNRTEILVVSHSLIGTY